uniref:RNase III domain-containing protein n=1 Tax=Haemonchus contortus TaxID=6289 RepID=A0A7I4YXJ6_HAECO
MHGKLKKCPQRELDDDSSESESDDDSISTVSDLQFSDLDNIVISDDTSEMEEGEVIDSDEDERDDDRGDNLSLDQEVFKRLMEEEYVRIDPATARIPEQTQHVVPVPCSDYRKSRSRPGEVRSASDYASVLETFRSLLKSIQQMKKERAKLEPVEKILVHSCWRCAQSCGGSPSESSISSTSDESDTESDDSSDTEHLSDISDDSSSDGDDGGDYDDSEMSDVERMNTRQRSSYLLRKEFDRKYRSGAALCEDICFNEPEVGAYGLMCRCSPSAKKSGLRHNVFPGESRIPNCTPNENNASKLHHYVLVVRRPTAPLGEGTRTRISHNGDSYVFQGFSVFFHRELPAVIPLMPVSRYINEYEFHFEKAPMINCFTVEELDMFHQYLFVDLLELYDESLYPFGVTDGCPIYHVMPRFICEKDGVQHLLPMSVVVRYLCDSFVPIVSEKEAETFASCTETEITKMLAAKRFHLTTNPRKRPSTIRIDNIKRPTAEFPCYAIEHKASPPIAYANLKNPELAEAQRRLNKLRHAQSSTSTGQKEHLDEMNNLLKRINEIKQQRAASLNTTKVIPCTGFLATGLYADVTAHVLLMILAVKHARLHWSLSEFEKIIDYKFANRNLIELAFTHPSYKNDFGVNVDHVKTTLTNCLFRRYAPFTENNEKKKGFRNLMHIMSQSGSNTAGLSKVAHNERLEYLGDAVVELIVSSRLFFILPHQEEGGLATYRSALVQNRNLAALGKKLHLGDWMMYAHGIDLCDEEDFRKSLANTFEAVLAAIYLDGGIEECDRIFADAMFGDDPAVKDQWLNVPEHPLKVEQPDGDRMIIDDTDELLELTDLEDILGFRFQNIRLLAKALTRRNVPYNTLTCGNNQRLEWLGDAVLQLVISNYLYHHFPNHHEGHLSLLRTCLVCNETQSQICEDLGLHCFIIHPPGGGSRLPDLSLKDKADLVEALLGAIFVDRGWDYCRAFIYICFLPRLKHFIESKKWNDSKSQLQQCCLALRELDAGDSSAPEMPEYRTIGIEGSTNARHYRVAVYFRNMRLAVGEACTVHLAQMNAAKKALEEYKEMFSSISRNNVKNAASAFIKKLQEAQQRPSTYKSNEEPRPRPLPLIGAGSVPISPPPSLRRNPAPEPLVSTPKVTPQKLGSAAPLVNQMLKSVAASYRQFSAASSSLQNAVIHQTPTPLFSSQATVLVNSLPTMSPLGSVSMGLPNSYTSRGSLSLPPSLFQITPQYVNPTQRAPLNQSLLQFGSLVQTPSSGKGPQPLFPKLTRTEPERSPSPSTSTNRRQPSGKQQPSERPLKRRREAPVSSRQRERSQSRLSKKKPSSSRRDDSRTDERPPQLKDSRQRHRNRDGPSRSRKRRSLKK